MTAAAGPNGELYSAVDGVAVTPSDSTVLAATRSLYVSGAGDVAVEMISGNTVTFAAVPAGTVLPVQVVKVLATGTTASSIVAMY